MGKLVLYAHGAEALRMIGCRHARHVSHDVKENTLPMICHQGSRCACWKSESEREECSIIKSHEKQKRRGLI